MIEYTDSLAGIEPHHLHGFFVGWWEPPTPDKHLRLLRGSDHVVLAIDAEAGRVVGFVTALTDGVQSAFIPLLEVLPEYQRRGIGQELMRLMLDRLDAIPNVDLMCDPDVMPFYERFGMTPATGMVIRRRIG